MSIIIRAWYEPHDGTTRARIISHDGERNVARNGVDDVVNEIRHLLHSLESSD